MWMNKHAQVMRHKRHLKRKHAISWGYRTINADEDRDRKWNAEFHPDSMQRRNGGYTYWRKSYKRKNSDFRKFCKQRTNDIIRAKYRNLEAMAEAEDASVPSGSLYEKEFDMLWTLY